MVADLQPLLQFKNNIGLPGLPSRIIFLRLRTDGDAKTVRRKGCSLYKCVDCLHLSRNDSDEFAVYLYRAFRAFRAFL